MTRYDVFGISDRLGGFVQWSFIKRVGLLSSVNSCRFHKANERADRVGNILVKILVDYSGGSYMSLYGK